MPPNSTVSELPFVYVQWNQTVTLFPVIAACKGVALQPTFRTEALILVHFYR